MPCGAVNPVAPGLRADVVDRVAGAGRDALDDVARLRNPETEDVDERIARVRRVEDDLAADGRDADAVAVSGDAGNDARHQPRGSWRIERSEAQRVHQRDRPRAH